MFMLGRSWARSFTSRVANVMVRKSIFIDISFLQKLNEKARLIPGLFFYIFYAQARTCRVASYIPGRKRPELLGPGSRVQGLSPVKIMIVICICFVIMCIQKWLMHI